jgi:predicted secreted Zn-dependent protease
VPPDVRVEYYEIRGATVAELRAQMAALNPRNDGGVPHDAHAEWHVDWRYPFQRSPQGCATGPSTVTVRTTYTLPRWHDEALGPLDVQRRWTCFFSAILVHEDGHRLHGQEAAAQVRALLPTLPPQPTCPEMDALANAEARKVLQHFREVDEEYDRNTRHGATQGALLR